MKSTLSILFYIKRKEPKKNGMASIIIRITMDGERVQFNSRLEIAPSEWDSVTGKGKGKSFRIRELNNQLECIKSKLYQIYFRLSIGNNHIGPSQIRDSYLSNEENTTLINQFERHNKLYKKKSRGQITHKTYTRYELTKNRLIEFMQQEYKMDDIQIHKITLDFIERFYLFIRGKYHCSNNTTMKFLQRFRTIVNYAEHTGIIQANPFSFYKLHFDPTTRVFLNQQEITTIWKKKFITERLSAVRDMFIFSCFSGLSFIDICELKGSNIQLGFDGRLWIIVHRHKTNNPSHIPLMKIPLQILNKYKKVSFDERIFPINSNQKTNEYLKEIGEICGIHKAITFHMARHSFSTTITLGNGVPMETISNMLGHNRLETTQIYAKVTNLKISQDMGRLLDMDF